MGDERKLAKDEAQPYGELPCNFGRWRLVRLVGEGSWARVFQARPADADPSGPADYALKILKAPYDAHPAYVELFRREDYVGRRMAHPHLAPVLASSLKRRPYWLALPYLEGVSLETRLVAAGRLAPSTSVWIVRQAAQALAALHSAGWMHGDVKPHNLVVSPGGHATLVDLGFARPIRPDVAARVPTPSREVLAATPAYAAPETLSDTPEFGAPSDIYSLGVTLFECLSGRRPFGAERGDIADGAPTDGLRAPGPAPDVRTVAPWTPAPVAELLAAMLARRPADRPLGERLLDELVSLEIEMLGQRLSETPARYWPKTA